MSTTKGLKPLTDLSKKLINKEDGDIKIKYMKGSPRQYRFNASNGFFAVKGAKENLTSEGQHLTIIPIAYQIFTDSILGEQYGRLRWVELIFLNEKLQVCSILLHGYSVDNLLSKSNELFYDDKNFCEVKLTISPTSRKSKSPEAKGAKYWIAEFSYELIDGKELEKLQDAVRGLDLYREDIYTVNREVELTKNYGIPSEIKKQLAEAGTGKKEAAEKPEEGKKPEKAAAAEAA